MQSSRLKSLPGRCSACTCPRAHLEQGRGPSVFSGCTHEPSGDFVPMSRACNTSAPLGALILVMQKGALFREQKHCMCSCKVIPDAWRHHCCKQCCD